MCRLRANAAPQRHTTRFRRCFYATRHAAAALLLPRVSAASNVTSFRGCAMILPRYYFATLMPALRALIC